MGNGITHMNSQENLNSLDDNNMKIGELIRVRTHDSPWSDPMIIMSAPHEKI